MNPFIHAEINEDGKSTLTLKAKRFELLHMVCGIVETFSKAAEVDFEMALSVIEHKYYDRTTFNEEQEVEE